MSNHKHEEAKNQNIKSPSSKPQIVNKQVKDGLEITIPKFETISEGYWGLKSYTRFLIVTQANNVPMLESDTEYSVWRRFSDFEWFHNSLTEQDEYKGLVLPSLPEKSYFSKNDEAFVESRRHDLANFLSALSAHKIIKNSRLFHLFLTVVDEDEFNELKSHEGTLKSRLFEYAHHIMKMDTDYLVANIGQYFDKQEPENLKLPDVITSRIQELVEWETELTEIAKTIKAKHELYDSVSTSMSQIALSLEKFRLNSETVEMDKLFSIGGLSDDDDIDDLDNPAFSRINSRENDPAVEEFDRISRMPFKKNFFPSLKECSRVTGDVNEHWKFLHRSIKIQLAKIQGMKDAMKRRAVAIDSYKTNLTLMNKKRVKQESNVGSIALLREIEQLQQDNKSLEERVSKINKDLCADLTDFSIPEVIDSEVSRFTENYKSGVEAG